MTTDRRHPIARLEPAGTAYAGADEDRIARLERAGVVRRARGAPAADVLTTRAPRPKKGADVLAVLLDERRSGR